MNTTFTSGFAAKIDAMLDFREARGYKRGTYLAELQRLDKYCAEHFPGQSELTSDVVIAWYDAETELGGNLVAKATALRHLGHYLSAMGEDAYVLPERVAAHRHSFTPYMFTDDELSSLFAAIDRLPPLKGEPFLAEMLPTLFRLTYTCALRPNESRELLCENVNLDTGEILVTNTKRKKERYVVMSDDMLSLARSYDFRRGIFGGDSPYFFPASSGEALHSEQVLSQFNKAWTLAECNKNNPNPRRVRVYDLRHRAASACLNRWLDEGCDLMAMLPYLRAFMGHNSLSETAYYIHILPENLVKSSAIDWDAFNELFSETEEAAR